MILFGFLLKNLGLNGIGFEVSIKFRKDECPVKFPLLYDLYKINNSNL